MNKICTTIEQSKKLIELGIDRKTSDMYYWCGSDLRIGGYRAQDEEGDIPAWSLSALLELIPKEQHPKLVLNAHYKWICDIYKPASFAYEPTAGENPLDAAFEMVVWLKENGKI